MLEWPQHKILIFKHSRADNSAVRGRIWSNFELIRDIVVILVTCKNEEDPLKNKDARVATTQNIDFSHSHGQITLQSRVESGWDSNSSEMLWLSLLLPRAKKIWSKLKALEWPQHKIMLSQTLKGSKLHSQRWDLAEIRTHPRYYSCLP